jgi:ABC-type spermidine/putrescine transport system permease subunit II
MVTVRWPWAGAVPALAVVIVLFGGALLGAVRTSLQVDPFSADYSLEVWRGLFADPSFTAAVGYTLGITVVATALSVVLAVPTALALRGRSAARSLATLPVLVPHLLVAAVAVLWLGPGGVVDRVLGDLPIEIVRGRSGFGIVLVYVVKEVPFLALLLLTAWDGGVRAREEAAAVHGGGPRARIRHVLLPAARPHLIVGTLIVAAFVLGSFEVPLVVGPTRPDTIATYALCDTQVADLSGRAVAAAALLVATAAALLLAVIAGLTLSSGDVMGDHRAEQRWAVVISAFVVVPLLILPIRALADIWRAPALLPQQWGSRGLNYLTSSGARIGEAITTSLVVALITTAVALAIGWPAARALSRLAPRSRALVLTVLAAPLLVPPFATGTGLVGWFLQLEIADRIAGLVAAHLIYVLPYVVLILAPAFGEELPRLEEAAATSGAGPWRRLTTVALPMTARPIAIAALLGFLVSWSQYGTSLAVGGGRLTLPLVLLPFVDRDPQLTATLSLVFLLPPLVALAAVHGRWGDRRRTSAPPR